MYYIGIDVAKRSHCATVIDESGKIQIQPFKFNNTKIGFDKMYQKFLSRIPKGSKCIVGMEATGHYWICLFDYLNDKGFDVVVINPIQTDAFRKVDSIRKTKTDDIDSNLIAQLLRFGDYQPSKMCDENVEALKQITRYRKVVVDEITSIKNKVTSLLDRIFPEYENIFSQKFGQASIAVLKECSAPEDICAKDIRTLTKIISEASAGKCGRTKAEELKNTAKESISTKLAAKTISFEIKQLVSRLEFSLEQLSEIDDEMQKLLEETPGKYLTSIPGISTVLASIISSEIGDPTRFNSSHQLVAYAGMDASRYQSGEIDHTGHMSKRGNSYLRYAFMLAAESTRKFDPYLSEAYAKKIAEGKHHYIALSVVARKLCGIVLTIMREERKYEPNPPEHCIPGHNNK